MAIIQPSRNSPIVRKCQIPACSGDAVADAQLKHHTSWAYLCKAHLQTKGVANKQLITNITNKPLDLPWID